MGAASGSTGNNQLAFQRRRGRVNLQVVIQLGFPSQCTVYAFRTSQPARFSSRIIWLLGLVRAKLSSSSAGSHPVSLLVPASLRPPPFCDLISILDKIRRSADPAQTNP